jgi:Cdc6-like AAA superfamily ATPase
MDNLLILSKKFEEFLTKFKLNVRVEAKSKTSQIFKDHYYNLYLEPPTRLKHIRAIFEDIELYFLQYFYRKVSMEIDEFNLRIKFLNYNKDYEFLEYKDKLLKLPNYTVALGIDDDLITYNPKSDNHLLIGGMSGMGKSTLLKSIIQQLLWSKVYINIFDTKCIDFKEFEDKITLSNNIVDIITMLKFHNKRISKIFETNIIPEIPTIIVIDEFSDLMLSEFSDIIKNELMKVIQKSRAANTFVVLATQRPSAKIIDGGIKANFQNKVSLKAADKINSRLILDNVGAETIENKGECIIVSDKYSYKRFKSFKW